MTIEISEKSEIYAVLVTETMTCEETILVYADSRDEAQRLAEKNVSFDTFDFQSDGVKTSITKTNPPLDSLKVYDYVLVGNTVCEVEEFLEEYMGSEECERRRIAAIEKENGQIALPL